MSGGASRGGTPTKNDITFGALPEEFLEEFLNEFLEEFEFELPTFEEFVV